MSLARLKEVQSFFISTRGNGNTTFLKKASKNNKCLVVFPTLESMKGSDFKDGISLTQANKRQGANNDTPIVFDNSTIIRIVDDAVTTIESSNEKQEYFRKEWGKVDLKLQTEKRLRENQLKLSDIKIKKLESDLFYFKAMYLITSLTLIAGFIYLHETR